MFDFLISGGKDMKLFQILKSEKFILLCIFFLGFFFFFYGIQWGLPSLWYPDEPETIEQIVIPMARYMDPNPHIFHKGSFYYYFLEFILAPYFLYVKLFGVSLADYSHLVKTVTLISRIATACVGLIGLFLMYQIGKRVTGIRGGLWAAFLLCIHTGYAAYAHFAYMEVPLIVLILTSFYFALRYLEDFKLRNFYLCAFFGGLAMSTKYNGGLFAVLFLLICWIVSRIRRASRVQIRSFMGRPIWISVGIVIFAFLLGTPFAVLDWKTFLMYLIKHSFVSQGYKVFTGGHAWIGNVQLLEKSFGPWAFFVVVFSFFWVFIHWMIRPRAKEAFLVFPPLLYFIYAGSWRIMAVRYMLPVVPFLILSTALVLDRIAQHPKIGVRRMGIGIFALVGMLTIRETFLNIRCFHTDTRFSAEAWIDRHIPKDKIIEVYSYGAYLPRFSPDRTVWQWVPNFISESKKFDEFQNTRLGKFLTKKMTTNTQSERSNAGVFRIEALHNRNPDYIILTSFFDDRFIPQSNPYVRMVYPELALYYETLTQGKAGYRKVVQFENPRMQEFYLNPTISIWKRKSESG